MLALFKLFHLLSVLIWVGGMFFAYVMLRPAIVEILEPSHACACGIRYSGVFSAGSGYP